MTQNLLEVVRYGNPSKIPSKNARKVPKNSTFIYVQILYISRWKFKKMILRCYVGLLGGKSMCWLMPLLLPAFT